jgi:hypothetical protein
MTKLILLTLFAALFIGILLLVNNLDTQEESSIRSDSVANLSPYAGWKEFTAQTGKFKASLPNKPQNVQEMTEIPGSPKKRHYDMYAAQKVNGVIFMISLITYPNDYDIPNSDQLLREVIHEMVENNPKNQLENISHSVFQDQKALDFQISNDEFHIQGKTFLIQQTIYLLTYVAKKEDFDENEYQYFLDSFHVQPMGEEVKNKEAA